MEENDGLFLMGDDIKPKKLLLFQDLRKPTVGETYKYLNKLVVTKKIYEFENLNELVSSVIPLPLFEETLRVMLIDSLQLENEIVKILLSQNDCQIQRILRCKWFFINLSSELCIKELFPYISMSLRCQLINRLSKHLENSHEAEKYFVFIKNNYSYERAEYLLPRCSPEFILNYFNEAKPTFEHNNRVRILFNICKRYPEVGIQMLSSIFDRKKTSPYDLHKFKKILWCLAGYRPDLIVPFLKKYYSYLPSETFGIKLTKKLGPKLKEILFPDLVKNLIFKEKLMFSILNFDEQVKFIATIVILNLKNLTFFNWENSSHKVSTLLKWVPPEDRLRMIEAVFKEVYNLNYEDWPKCWHSEMLELVPVEKRQPFITKLEIILKTEKCDLNKNEDPIAFSVDDPEELIYLFDSNTALEKFKKILQKCPTASTRERILPFLIKNCSINNDIQMLQKVVDFIATRHRNDEPSVIFNFLGAINDNFSATQLNSTIFEKLEDLMYFSTLKEHSRHLINQYPYSCLREKKIYYNLENDLNVENEIKNFFETKILKMTYGGSFVNDVRSKHSKSFILALCDKIVAFIRSKSTGKLCSTSKALLTSLLNTCSSFNKSNKQNQIFLRDIPGLNDILKEKLKEYFSDLGAEDWPSDIWEKFYNDVTNSYHMQNCLSYILKQNPDIVEKRLEGTLKILFLNFSKRFNSFFSAFLMMASFFKKLEKVKEIILNEFKNGDSTFKRKNALELYSRVCTVEEFIEAVKDYIPQKERIERGSNDGFDQIQILIPGLIKNIRPRWKNLELTLKFFFGDYLKTVLPSFWACCCSTRCDLAIPFLKKQLDSVPQKISYKKDIIKLIIELSDREGKFSFYRKCWDEYKHYSIRTILLLQISKSFLEMPSKELFQLLEKCILDCDSLIIKSRPNLRMIPKVFLNDYVLALWKFSENQRNPFKNNFRNIILTSFDQDSIKFLSLEFIESIIEENLFNSSSELHVENFTILYLTADFPKAVESRIRTVLNLKGGIPNSQCFSHFTHLLINNSQTSRSDFSEIVSFILENWPDFPRGGLFEERLLLNYQNLYQKVLKRCSDSNKIPAEFGKELRKLYSSVDDLHDLLVLYAEVLKNFFSFLDSSKIIFVIKELVSGSPDRTLVILAILSLPKEPIAWYKQKNTIFEKSVLESNKALQEVIKTFESYNDRIIDIYLNSKLNFIYQ